MRGRYMAVHRVAVDFADNDFFVRGRHGKNLVIGKFGNWVI
jgi:hypothetical protein